MREYTEEEMLQLSGIQHYVLCPRQWALIHMEQYWEDNGLTAEGTLLHANVDNPFYRETSGTNILTLRGLRLSSKRLGLSGIADAVEIIPHSEDRMTKAQLLESGKYDMLPIEYKRGTKKISDCDRIQVTAQAMILEEQFKVHIKQGAIFYWQDRHREYFEISDELRRQTEEISIEMHRILETNTIPKSERKRHCQKCSLMDYCMPGISERSAKRYVEESIRGLMEQ